MPLRILKASAGSGKTFSLTESYVRICLEESNALDFSNILAITFTNKASAEMKDRIIGLLHQLSHDPSSYPGIKNMQNDLKMSLQQIQQKSQGVLYRVLRGFDQFSITTIDSFFTRLYGSMALDLFIEAPRDITFEIENALDEAADALIRGAREDEELQDVLIDLLEEKIKEGQGVNLKQSLMKLGQELFKDDYLQLREASGYVQPEKDFHLALTQQLDLIMTTYEGYQEKLEGLLEEAGMEHKDFTGSFTDSIIKRENPQNLLELKGFQKLAYPEEWFAKAKKEEMTVKVEPIRERLQTLGQEFYDYCLDIREKYVNYSVIRDNYASYRILQYLDEALKTYFEEQRLTSLPDINLKIHQNLGAEDSMIIYEKIGQRLLAVMIDEFQDTAQIQWNNLKPLMQNSLAEGHPNLVVGDVKQAIYRFRNGNWEIMELEVPEFQKQWQPDGKAKIENLPVNWRSSPEIIEFNNQIFNRLSQSVSDELVNFLEELILEHNWSANGTEGYSEVKALANAPRTIYGNRVQEVSSSNQNKTGYVEVDYRYFDHETEDETIESERMEWLRNVILDLHQDGYSGDDIGILSRGKKQLGILADYLSRWAEKDPLFRFSSEDSLKLALSDGIQLLIAALKIKAGKDPEISQIVFGNYYLKLTGKSWEKALAPAEKEEMNALLSSLDRDTGIEQLYMFFEFAIDRFELSGFKGQYPYLLSFLEEVKKFELQHGPDVSLFLDQWNNHIQFIKIRMSDDAEKIRLFTIHKSKGLEFEVVLLPFGKWDFEVSGHDTILWEADQTDELLQYAGPLPVRYSSTLLYSSFHKALISEYIRNVIDHMNLLYVALTRPKDRLYVWLSDKAPKNKKPKKPSSEFVKPLRNTLDLFGRGLDGLSEGDEKIIKGQKIRKMNEIKPTNLDVQMRLDSYPFRHDPLPLRLKPSFDGAEDEAIGQGLVIHRLLENIEFHRDIAPAIQKALQAGDIREKDREKWQERLIGILDYAPASPYFQEDWKVYNEKSIMVTGGGEYRPDRIQENGREFIVIDYKTGKKRTSHEEQIKNYRKVIAGMVNLPVRCFIYYPLTPEWIEVT